jgi:hypothetical protein
MVILVLGFLVLSVLLFQPARAQGPSLKPPFKLIRSEQPSSLEPHGPVAFPLNGPIIISQTFDSNYAPVGSLNQLGWHETTGISATIGYTWKYEGVASLTNTVWSAGRNPSGYPLLNPATDTYTRGMEALLIYGPLNLSDYYQLVMTSTYWLDAATGDYTGVAYSTDGTNFIEVGAQSFADPTLSNAHTAYAGLNVLAGKPNVWIAFTFVSNNDDLVGRGAFIKDMVLRGTPFYKIFLPWLRLDPTLTPTPTNTPTSTPTPTPTATPGATYRYFYTFGNGGPNNTDFNIWGGKNTTTTTCNGSPCAYYQDIVTLGNPGGAMTMYSYDLNLIGGAGPRQSGASLTTATNFEYSADFYVYTGQTDARYGLVFDASSSTFPGSGDPPFAPQYNYYFLQMRIDTTTRTQVATWQIKRVVNGGSPQNITAAANLPFSITQGQWHNLKIRQSGTTLIFFLNGFQQPITGVYDSNWGDSRRHFGTYIDIRDSNNDGGNPFEVFFDNVGVRDLP